MTNEQFNNDELSFSAIPLSPQLTRAVEDMHYSTATDIQASAIPFLLDGQDVIGHSSTGTGKTAAFGIPAVENVDGSLKKPQVLVLSPTRELALQISREMQKYAKYKEGICIATVYGGSSMTDQIRLLKRANIVVGTPGRLMDHLRRKTLKMDNIKMVVLDEADEMLSMGFIDDIQTILSQAPEERQTVLFSATMPPPILKMSKEFLKKPQIVDVMEGQESQADIEQTFYYVPKQKKIEALCLLLEHANTERSIVFCNTKSMVDELAELLNKQGLKASGLHGDMTQAARTQVMSGFRTGRIHILVATDVAARGIDVDDVDTVINFDLPQSFEYYVHRIGRTGRAGKAGVSQTIICHSRELNVLKGLMRFTGTPIEEKRLPSSKQIMERAVAKQAEALMPYMHKKPGKAAKMLINNLIEAEGGNVSVEDIAYILAEKLLGGDERFKSNLAENSGTEKSTGLKGGSNAKGGSGCMVIVKANIGRNGKVTPNHLVGAIAELLNVPGKSIGKIEIMPEQTFIGLKEDVAKELLAYDKPIKINGSNVTFTMQRKKAPLPAASSFKKKGKKKYKR